MYRPTLPAVVPVPVPLLELWIGLAWWTVGATAFETGPGTAVLAAGLVVVVWLYRAARRVHGIGAPLPRGGRAALLRHAGVTIGLIVALGVGLGLPFVGFGELVAPFACVLVGLALVRSSGVVGGRTLGVVGAALVVLGVCGAALALHTTGDFYGRGLVGLGAAALLWSGGAYRTRVLADLRIRR